MSQPNCAPFARYSRILSLSFRGRSVEDFNSIAKSGQRCQNLERLAGLSCAMRLFSVQAASGERRAPLGSTKPVEESLAKPRPSCSAHTSSCLLILVLRTPVNEYVGGITNSSPSAVISKKRSGFSAQNRANSSSVMGGTVRVAGRNASSITNAMAQCNATPGATPAGAWGGAVRPRRPLHTSAVLLFGFGQSDAKSAHVQGGTRRRVSHLSLHEDCTTLQCHAKPPARRSSRAPGPLGQPCICHCRRVDPGPWDHKKKKKVFLYIFNIFCFFF